VSDKLDLILAALSAEFADLADIGEATQVTARLLVAAVLGGLLGLERELQGKAAGLRTHMLVAMGATLFVLVPQMAGMGIADLSRVIQGVIQGIGFLGAGAIMRARLAGAARSVLRRRSSASRGPPRTDRRPARD
jgi:putative Mg2+ transporter-C (MgtC) family protein